jgi:hypothetical protein
LEVKNEALESWEREERGGEGGRAELKIEGEGGLGSKRRVDEVSVSS